MVKPKWFVHKNRTTKHRQWLGKKFKSTETELAAIAAASSKAATIVPAETVRSKLPGKRWMAK